MKSRATTLLAGICALGMQLAIAAEGASVARAAFTSGINSREPVDRIEQLDNTANSIYFFTELRNLAGQTVTHRWQYGGETKAEVSFNVGGDRWRVYSSKNLLPEWTGEWRVDVVDGGGNVIASESFQYGNDSAAKPMDAAAEAAREETENN